MTTFAIISDLHANAYALAAVLDDIRARGAAQVFCLGDVVGYNARPSQTIRMLREAAIPTVQGNHDLMAVGDLGLDGCGPNARYSQLWTRECLGADELRYLRGLPTSGCIDDGAVLLHSCLEDPLSYLSSDEDYLGEYLRIRAWRPAAQVCFTGHTHVARIVEVAPDRRIRRLPAASADLAPGCFYFVNPGSVGHPRGGDYRAGYALFERSAGRVRLLRVRYDKARMQRENERVGIRTHLGAGVLEHRISRLTGRLKRAPA